MSWYLIALCVVQGISEFLPISSSAHLVLFSYFFKQPPTSLEWEVALHLGTLLAVVIHFWRDLWQMAIALFGFLFLKEKQKTKESSAFKMALSLIIATLPAVVIGYVVKKLGLSSHNATLIAWMSIIFGLLLYIADRFSKGSETSFTPFKAFLIGCAQTLAFIPGASRSGSCITAARALGINRVEATRFTFLLSIPTVVGAVGLTAYDALKQGIALDIYALGMAVVLTALIGIGVIKFLLWFLERHSFACFMLYRVALGIAILLFA